MPAFGRVAEPELQGARLDVTSEKELDSAILVVEHTISDAGT
jgi:hypothetical protein